MLSSSEMFWLSTVRRDGRPHVTPLPAIWLDGRSTSAPAPPSRRRGTSRPIPGASSRPARTSSGRGSTSWSRDPPYPVTDTAQLERLAAIWRSKLDWDFEVADGAFRDSEGRRGLVFGVSRRRCCRSARASRTAKPATASPPEGRQTHVFEDLRGHGPGFPSKTDRLRRPAGRRRSARAGRQRRCGRCAGPCSRAGRSGCRARGRS